MIRAGIHYLKPPGPPRLSAGLSSTETDAIMHNISETGRSNHFCVSSAAAPTGITPSLGGSASNHLTGFRLNIGQSGTTSWTRARKYEADCVREVLEVVRFRRRNRAMCKNVIRHDADELNSLGQD